MEAVLDPPSPLSLPVATPPAVAPAAPTPSLKPWTPKQVLFTPSSLGHDYGRELLDRFTTLGLPVTRLKADRVSLKKTGHPQKDYALAKNTLAVVVSPPSSLKLQPIPPSADWQFHLATGCPAHCQYCYLAGSLSGPPITRVFANLREILDNNASYEGRLNGKAKQRGKSITPGSDDGKATFEVSCYTDVLALEHLTGGLARAVEHFGTRPDARLRFVTKFARVGPLLSLKHNGHTRARSSVNATAITKQFEGGTNKVPDRLDALTRLAADGYPVGLVIAPIFPLPDWQSAYADLITRRRRATARC